MIGRRNLAKSNSLWQLVYSMNFRRSTYMYVLKDVLFKADKNRWCRLVQGFFTLQCPKIISAIAMSKKIITGRSVVCVVNFILLFFGNWNCVWLVYSTANCTEFVLSFMYPTCLFVGLV